MANTSKFIFSVDLDWVPGSDVPMMDLFDIFVKHQIKPAMFFTSGYAQHYPHILRKAAELKYNIGTHGMLHGYDWLENFGDNFPRSHKMNILKECTSILEEMLGYRPMMFRAPFLNISEDTWDILVNLGYKIDSSIPAKRFDFFNGTVNNFKYFTASSSPFVVKTRYGNLLEIPPSAFILPLNMRFLTMFHIDFVMCFTQFVSLFNPYIVFYLHPTEFVISENLTLTNGHSKKFFKHCHNDNLKILEHYIIKLRQADFQFCQMSDLLNEFDISG